jgi:ectoine hydroxylase-related dioxygenase (phytanoyl-CoA dioxygenase family)
MITSAARTQIFKRPEQHLAFERDGFVVLDFFQPEEITAMLAHFESLRPEGLKGFYTTTFDNDPEYRTKVDLALRAVFERPVSKHFVDYKYFFSSFIAKAPDPKSELILHQDMTLVDEARFPGLNIWAPLVDLTMDNGPIYVLPGSHRLKPTYRGSSLPDIYDGIEKEVISVMTPLLLKAGQAVAFDQSLLHYSPANLSDKERIVVNTFISNEAAKIQICFHDKEKAPDKVEIFAQADDFLRHYTGFGTDIFKRPTIGESLGYVDYNFPKVTLAELEAKYGKTDPTRKAGHGRKNTVPPIFVNTDLQRQFDEDGFVQLPLLLAEDVKLLRELYFQYFPESPQAFHSSSYLPDFPRKKEMSNAIVDIFRPRLDAIFQNFFYFGSAFLTKNTGKNSLMPMHQDWTIVDEQRFVAVNIWTPLQDADAKNGGLQVLRGSHRYLPVLRCPTIPFFFEDVKAEMAENLTQLTVKAGQAVILNQALIHASPPNMSDQMRLAITTGIKTANAPMRFHYQAAADELEVFAMDDDFLLRFEEFHKDIYERPKFGESLGKVPFVQEQIGREALIEMIRKSGRRSSDLSGSRLLSGVSAEVKKQSFFQRLFGR